jgi:predicted dehydrogenase
MLDKAKPEAVFICIPPYCHGEIEYELINRGIHFFVEKPLALDLDLAKDILKKSEAAGLITASGFQCRYSNLVEPNKDFCKNNDVIFVSCERMGGIPGAPWWQVKSLSGGQAVEQTIHQFDIIRYVYGEPETVFSMGARGLIKNPPEGYDTDDLSVTCVRFENGTLCTISTGCYATGSDAYNSRTIFSSRDKRGEMRLATDFEIFGQIPEETEGMGDLVVKGDGGLANASDKGVLISNKVPDSYGFKCDRTFLEAVMNRDASKIRCDYEDGMKTVAFGLACNKSMETGLPVKVKDLLK